jgi:lipoprotein NlpI
MERAPMNLPTDRRICGLGLLAWPVCAVFLFPLLPAAAPAGEKDAESYQKKGEQFFKEGKFKESVDAFDQFLKLRPDFKPKHWQRGISCYYAKQYKEGQEQFEGYQTFMDNDVENAVWRYLCMVPLAGKKKAQAGILKIGEDKRVPMRQIYDLFAGKLKPEDVLDAAKKGEPAEEQLNSRLFYAHLYLGLYYESEGQAAKALEHLEIAVKHRIGHYMWDVARIGRNRLLESAKK